jgi:hypothetical protein
VSNRKIFFLLLSAYCPLWGARCGSLPLTSRPESNFEQTADLPQRAAMAEGWLSGASLVSGREDLLQFTSVVKFASYNTFAGKMEWHRRDLSTNFAEFSSVNGLAGALKGSSSRTTFGGFFETAFASSSTHDDGPLGISRTRTLGIGAFGTIEFRQMELEKSQLEGAFRVGALHNSWEGEGPIFSHTFRGSVPYCAVRLGTLYGRQWRGKFPVYLYARYFWAYQAGKNFPDRAISFGAINSHRIRVGGRFAGRTPKRLVPWCDAYYEREFAATVKGSADGEEIPRFSLKGDRAGCNLGFTYQPLPALTADLSLQGSVDAKRKSLAACLCMGREF